MHARTFIATVVLVAAAIAPHSAPANERHLTFTEESATMAQGTFELEPWLTVYGGRTQSFVGFDYQLEFEGGLTDRVLAALYINGTLQTAPGPAGGTTGGIQTFSLESKIRLLDLGVDPIGFTLYYEVTASPIFLELETRFIVDRRFGNLFLAANLLLEYDWQFQAGGSTSQLFELEFDLGVGYFIQPQLMLGIEAREYNQFHNDEQLLFHEAALYAGPVLAYAWSRFWVALTVMPQIWAPVNNTAGDVRDLTDQNAVMARLLVGIHW